MEKRGKREASRGMGWEMDRGKGGGDRSRGMDGREM